MQQNILYLGLCHHTLFSNTFLIYCAWKKISFLKQQLVISVKRSYRNFPRFPLHWDINWEEYQIEQRCTLNKEHESSNCIVLQRASVGMPELDFKHNKPINCWHTTVCYKEQLCVDNHHWIWISMPECGYTSPGWGFVRPAAIYNRL